jgi:hypothetical protein
MVGSVSREEVEQQRVEEAAALLTQLTDSLRRHPSEQMASAARKAMMDLKPHVKAALEALEYIEWDRDLTDRERDLQHAFNMLLAVKRQPQ